LRAAPPALDEPYTPAQLRWHPSAFLREANEIAHSESDMSQDPIAVTKSKLDDLEQRIHAAKSSLGARGDLNDEAQREWKAMVDKHAEIRRALDAHPDHPAGVIEGVRFDVDILGTSFETWVAKVERDFDK
jgi:hypothetical protein